MADRDQLVNDALEHYEQPLLRYTRRLLGNLDQARDVVQDAFLQLCKGNQLPAADRLSGWLYTVCRNKAFDFLRKEKAMIPLETEAGTQQFTDPAPVPLEHLESRERQSMMLQRIGALPANQREVVQLKFGEGMSYKQISEITGHSVSNVGFLIHTAVSTLRRELTGPRAN